MFSSLALRIHGIEAIDKIDVRLFDNHGAPVDKNTFPLLVRQFNKCDNFYFEVDVTGDTTRALSMDVIFNLISLS